MSAEPEPNPLADSPHPSHKELVATVCLFVLAFATFIPALQNGFVGYDDPEYVTANPHVQQGLTWATIRWAFTNTEAAAWHPLTWLSHALDCQWFDLHPLGHHLMALLLHSFNVAMCFVVLFRLTGAFWRSWTVAALFGIHPLRVESVAWISERKDVLSGAFFFLTLWAYQRYARSSSKRATWYCLCLAFCVFGLLSKPMLVTVPLVLLLLDAWPLRRWTFDRGRSLVIEKIPFAVAAVLVSGVTLLAQPHSSQATVPLPILWRFENAAVSYFWYLAKIFWPSGLAPFYPPVEHWPVIVWLGALLGLLCITAAALALWRTHPYALGGWLWFIIMLLPVIGVVQIGEQSVTDRYSYLPSVGICLVVIWALTELMPAVRYQAVGLAAAGIAVSGVCAVLTCTQVTRWHSTETLFQHTLAVTRGNYLAHNNLGTVFEQEHRWKDAVEQYQLALKIKPGYAEALKNLGVVYEHTGQLDKAVECFQAALKARPAFAAAHNGIGVAFQSQGRFAEAAKEFEQALHYQPDFADARFNLALELERAGQLAQSEQQFAAALRLQPNSAELHSNLGVVLEKQGRMEEAIQQYLEAVRLKPDYARAFYNLGVARAKTGALDDAIAAFQRALQIQPDYPAARTNVAILMNARAQSQ